ncbi:hypothetical protein CSE16_02650 [Solibacillus sp. R5-41]|uniref:hypothetical protein n=1 Tax=Solibacillus sp. R5-41 TaxID=2048654 RepID=UPI000C1298D7|nr:hypothetical protein [Solibacillus sp. R5-41]ATP39008.1 hypothetical protein CSE16_02650 [Solibacillus sp. R5-41]
MATRTATGAQITKLKADDILYSGLDGQLSAAFKERSTVESNDYWTSSAYNFDTPAKAQVKITTNDGKTIIVVNNNLTPVAPTK